MSDEHTAHGKPTLSPSQQQEVDRLCSEFEQQWSAAQQLRIEDFLDHAAPEWHAALLQELIAAEVQLRCDAGEHLDLDDYLARFPNQAAAVRAGWDLIFDRPDKRDDAVSTTDVSRDPEIVTGGEDMVVDAEQQPEIPNMIGRYEVRGVLGRGGFGEVYLAFDPQLDRRVAIKVPRADRLTSEKRIEAFLHEARLAAQLKHPALVVVHDVQKFEGGIYVVQEYIEGKDLAHWEPRRSLSFEQMVRLIRQVVEAVGYAHQTQDLVHRDLKPANLLMDGQGQPHVADFGLALTENLQRIRKGDISGTPEYMSPEQARGEVHLLDGRSDLWSIGVVFYELLTGKRPFHGRNYLEVFEDVKNREPKPPRMLKPDIPSELQRICLRLLFKRATDRHSSATELLEDLDAWLEQASTPPSFPPAQTSAAVTSQTPAADSGMATPGSTSRQEVTVPDSTPRQPRIVPKGLRSFDAHDADFFLQLVPGARDRHGLPEGIRFWKLAIEECDPDKTFRVGLIYGPSGCGKSSMVKAGLLPRLDPRIVHLYVEATPEDTELRLIKGLKRHFHTVPDNYALPDLLAGIREGWWIAHDTKVLLVLDQFEQWLHARHGQNDAQLIQALRHCDGERLQCIVLVRDDFWMPATRFLRELEISLVEKENSTPVDLFDPLHARNVLAAFGRAYDRLPEDPALLTPQQETFLDRAVEGLTQDGKIICVRLALFADMFKGKPWDSATLAQVGGTEGLGVTFLEETFSASTAPAAHRNHQKAAQAVLRLLLPDAGTDIKGSRQPYDALLEASGYHNHDQDFKELVQILDNETRLITPTVLQGQDADAQPDAGHQSDDEKEKYYQLTHDYLVTPLRDWLTRKQKETRRGRAELKLEERTLLWNAKEENRHLPTWWEDLNIRLFTKPASWSHEQRKMMRRSGRVNGIRWSITIVALIMLFAGFQLLRSHNLNQRIETTVATVGNNTGNAVPGAIQNLAEFPQRKIIAKLNEYFSGADESQKLSFVYALAAYGEVDVAFLISAIANARAEECDNLVNALAHDPDSALQSLQEAAALASGKNDWQLETRLATVALYLGDGSVAVKMLQAEPDYPPEQTDKVKPDWDDPSSNSESPQIDDGTKDAISPTLSFFGSFVTKQPSKAVLPEWDPIQRTMFIEHFAKWSGSVEQLVSVVQDLTDPYFRSGISLAVGSIEEPTTAAKEAWGEVWSDWHVEDRHSGTHSATGWALREWKLPVPNIAASEQAKDGWNWHRTPCGLTMVRIPAGTVGRKTERDTSQQITVERDFWLSDKEITVGQFLEFLNDVGYQFEKPEEPEVKKPSSPEGISLPVTDVSWYDAVMFCNWLSRQEGLRPCYEKDGKEKTDYDGKIREYDNWKPVPGANGYSLPTENEWEYACRAMTTTIFSFGDDDDLLDRYAVFFGNAKDGPGVAGQKLCNAWGLFDMHGNVWEWCQDWYDEGVNRVGRGGGWDEPATLCRSAARYWIRPDYRILHLGFRVAAAPPSEWMLRPTEPTVPPALRAARANDLDRPVLVAHGKRSGRFLY